MANDVNGLLQRAAGQFQQGDFHSVLAICDEVARIAPGHPEVPHMRGMALGRLSRVEEAIAAFEAAIRIHPHPHAVLSNLGNALRNNGRNEEAIDAYQKAVRRAPDFLNGWFNLGIALRDGGRLEDAEAAFRQGLAINSNHAGILNNLGALLTSADKWEEAISLFDRALAVKPELVSALVNRGAALRAAGNVDAARVDLQKAIALAPRLAEAHYQFANILRQAGDRRGAETAYCDALACDPDRKDIHEDYAKMLWEFGESGRFLAALDRTIATRPSHDLQVLRATLCSRAGDFDGAARAARSAQSLSPESGEALRLEAVALRAMGDLDAAIARAEKALDVEPGNLIVRHELAELWLVAGRYRDVVELLSGDCPDASAQKHIALRALALRACGDSEYEQYYDYDRFTAQIAIKTPPGYPSIEAFNSALHEALKPLHPTQSQPIDQTLYGGTQSLGSLWRQPHPVIRALRAALLEAASRFIAELPDDPAHPFLRQKTQDLKCAGSWSVMLSSGGGHVDHIHPKGWISAAYYVRVPDEVGEGEKAGFLRLGASGVTGLDLEAERWLKPIEGTAIFFPSYLWHGVEPFSSPTQRVTAPFDLAPALRSH